MTFHDMLEMIFMISASAVSIVGAGVLIATRLSRTTRIETLLELVENCKKEEIDCASIRAEISKELDNLVRPRSSLSFRVPQKLRTNMFVIAALLLGGAPVFIVGVIASGIGALDTGWVTLGFGVLAAALGAFLFVLGLRNLELRILRARFEGYSNSPNSSPTD